MCSNSYLTLVQYKHLQSGEELKKGADKSDNFCSRSDACTVFAFFIADKVNTMQHFSNKQMFQTFTWSNKTSFSTLCTAATA